MDDSLTIRTENVSIRGKQSVLTQSALINLVGGKIHLNTSVSFLILSRSPCPLSRPSLLQSEGSVVISGFKGIYLGKDSSTQLDVSESPDLNASIDGNRLCMCIHPPGKLFIVPGNKKCYASTAVCQ